MWLISKFLKKASVFVTYCLKYIGNADLLIVQCRLVNEAREG